MRRDFKRRSSVRSRHTDGDRRPLYVAVGAALLLVGIAGFGTYQYKKQPERFVALSECYTKLTTWMTERKQHLNHSIKVVKQITMKDETDQPVHFEFYTALPNMKVEVASNSSLEETNKAPHTAPKKAETTLASVQSEVLAKTPVSEPAFKSKLQVISADELEHQMSREFAAEVQTQTQYVVQLGVFHAADAAQKFRDALSHAGFDAVVSKAANKEKDAYRVQLGPYQNKTQALQAQRLLQKRGVTSIVRKVELS